MSGENGDYQYLRKSSSKYVSTPSLPVSILKYSIRLKDYPKSQLVNRTSRAVSSTENGALAKASTEGQPWHHVEKINPLLTTGGRMNHIRMKIRSACVYLPWTTANSRCLNISSAQTSMIGMSAIQSRQCPSSSIIRHLGNV